MDKFTDVINGSTPVLVDFFAEWCGPCKTMSPILSQVAKDLGERAKVLKVDVDKNPQAASAFNIRSVPTMIIFKNGEVKWKHSGVMPASEILTAVQRYADVNLAG